MSAAAALQIAASACIVAAAVRYLFWDVPRFLRLLRMMRDSVWGTTPTHKVIDERASQKRQPPPLAHTALIFAGAILCLVDGLIYDSLTVRIFGAGNLLVGLWGLRKRMPRMSP